MGLRNLTAMVFKSSLLSIPPSPCSPRSPLFSKSISQPRTASLPYSKPSTTTGRQDSQVDVKPPVEPLAWIWKCHMCQRQYPLGATRRCPIDGHYFCSGTTKLHAWRTQGKAKGNGKAKKHYHEACAHEFDFNGWLAYGDWRRAQKKKKTTASPTNARIDSPMHQYFTNTVAAATSPAARTRAGEPRDCWHACNYPSECRHGPLAMAIDRPPEPVQFAASDQYQYAGAQCPPGLPGDSQEFVIQDLMETIEDVAVDYGLGSLQDLLAASQADLYEPTPPPPHGLQSPRSPPTSPPYEYADGMYDMDIDMCDQLDATASTIDHPDPIDPNLQPPAPPSSSTSSTFKAPGTSTSSAQPTPSTIHPPSPTTSPDPPSPDTDSFINACVDFTGATSPSPTLDAHAHTHPNSPPLPPQHSSALHPAATPTMRSRTENPTNSPLPALPPKPPHANVNNATPCSAPYTNSMPPPPSSLCWEYERHAGDRKGGSHDAWDEQTRSGRSRGAADGAGGGGGGGGGGGSGGGFGDLYFTLDSEFFKGGAKRGRRGNEVDGRKVRRVGWGLGLGMGLGRGDWGVEV
ncbi:hypothetical protein EJ05DRAFT_503246 [Pseudovirgaria hyperparasitica]|uniref:Uncharacterized protein n=1 Tax=Pseudovirgaria hyperparasitica TaxID=470096 RepID=A0A6A6W127_9PEZI|nr:uncharacterized protein EJ05DRAFT_503246 [Pseudovirgaria hyperparasitica]KAF2755796.1 hypothetical protein EJ05DRAFT_503246 [Pseudovirgaria hyperparasitica]